MEVNLREIADLLSTQSKKGFEPINGISELLEDSERVIDQNH